MVIFHSYVNLPEGNQRAPKPSPSWSAPRQSVAGHRARVGTGGTNAPGDEEGNGVSQGLWINTYPLVMSK